MKKPTKVQYYFNFQAVCNCPECDELYVIDLGEDDMAEELEIDCTCGCQFELHN